MGWVHQVAYRHPIAFDRFADECRGSLARLLGVPAVPPLVPVSSPGHPRRKPPPPALGPEDDDLLSLQLDGWPAIVDLGLYEAFGNDGPELRFAVEVSYGSHPLAYVRMAAAAAALSALSGSPVLERINRRCSGIPAPPG